MTREIPVTEWAPFLESFTMQHDHWLVSVERVKAGRSDEVVTNLPLEGVIARTDAAPREIIVTVGGDTESHQRCAVEEPQRLLVESHDGVDTALRIEQEGGVTTRVAFRAPVSPEQVDGVR